MTSELTTHQRPGRPRGRARTWLVALAIASVAVSPIVAGSPAGADQPLLRVAVDRVRFDRDHAVHVRLRYSCPAASSGSIGSVRVAQSISEATGIEGVDDVAISCDGERHEVATTIPRASGDRAFAADSPLNVTTSVTTQSEVYRREIDAADGLSVMPANTTAGVADVETPGVNVTPEGTVQIRVTYSCPPRWRVLPKDWTMLDAYQPIPGGADVGSFGTPFGSGLVCDDTVRTATAELLPVGDARFVPDQPLRIQAVLFAEHATDPSRGLLEVRNIATVTAS